MESLFRAYFTEDKDIGNQQALIDMASGSGLDRQFAETTLDSEAGL